MRLDSWRAVAGIVMVLGLVMPTAAITTEAEQAAVPTVHLESVVDQDIARFWRAFDAINATTDPAERLRLIQTIYIDPGTPGLRELMTARLYTAQQYVDAIVGWPRFWASVRPLTSRSRQAVATLNDASKAKWPVTTTTTGFGTAQTTRSG